MSDLVCFEGTPLKLGKGLLLSDLSEKKEKWK